MAVGEWDQRQLCPDGGCVGVIGPDGTCKVCGRAEQNWGDERNRGLIDPPDDDEDEDDDDELDQELAGDEDDDDDDEDDGDNGDNGDDEPGEADHAVAVSSGEWSTRRLCGDGRCIGLLGPNGRCKVCGRTPAEAAGLTDGTSTTAAAAASRSPERTDRTDRDAAAAENPEPKARAACPDAGCTGAIGPDGHCDVCGKVPA